MKKLSFSNDPYFLSDVNIYYRVRDFDVVSAIVVYGSQNNSDFCVWEVTFQPNSVTPDGIRDWLVSEEAVSQGNSVAVSPAELNATLVESGVPIELLEDNLLSGGQTMDNVVKLDKYKPGKSTLLEMHEEISEGVFPFITFNVLDEDGLVVSSITIPWARFRDVEDRPYLCEVRSNDSDTTPRQTMYLDRRKMHKYIFSYKQDTIHYVFQFSV